MFKKLKAVLNYPISKKEFNYNFLKPWRWNWLMIKEFLKVVLMITGTIATIMIIILAINDPELNGEDEGYVETGDWSGGDSGVVYTPSKQDETNCNVAGIDLHGYLVTYISNDTKNDQGSNMQDQVSSEYVIDKIRIAEKNSNYQAILLDIDSTGGNPVAAEEIADALKRAKKPTVALIRTMGISGAYWVATGGDTIFASANSDVGGIGVTMSYLDNVKKNQKDGLNFNIISAGKYKDAGNPDKPLTAEEKALFMRDINLLNENFIKAVAENRKLDTAKVKQIADGSTILGTMALEKGLIDKIGTFYDAKDYISEQIGKDASICWY